MQARSAADTAHDREGVDQRQQLGDVVAIAAGEGHDQRNTAGIGNSPASGRCPQWCLDPLRARSTDEGPVSAPLERPHVRAVHHRRL